MLAATALLSRVPERALSIVVLNKLLFYLDLACLRDTGETLTGNPFVALKHGPVVAKYQKRLVGALVEAGVATQGSDGLAKPVRLNEGVDGPELKSEVEPLVEKIAQWSHSLSATRASDISHENLGWRLARAAGKDQEPKPINMYIAMQQIMDEDPWLEEPVDEAVLAVADEPGIPW